MVKALQKASSETDFILRSQTAALPDIITYRRSRSISEDDNTARHTNTITVTCQCL